MNKGIGIFLRCVLLCCLLIAAQARAVALIEVNSTDGSSNFGNSCTIFLAVQSALTNTALGACAAGDPSGNVIQFNIPGGPATIFLKQPIHITDDFGGLPPGLKPRAGSIAINGLNRLITFDGSQMTTFGPMFIVGSATDDSTHFSRSVTFSELNFVNGRAQQGGAIFSTLGGFHRSDCADGIPNHETGALAIQESVFISNRATDSGGAIYIRPRVARSSPFPCAPIAQLNIRNSEFATNFASQCGGAICSETPNSVTVLGKALPLNGGVHVNVDSSTFFANSVHIDGVTQTPSGEGGAIASRSFNKSGIQLSVVNSTFHTNGAKEGASISSTASAPLPAGQSATFIRFSTFFNNDFTPAHGYSLAESDLVNGFRVNGIALLDSIVYDSSATDACKFLDSAQGSMHANLGWPNPQCANGNSFDLVADPMFSQFGFNGGLTQTYSLQTSSPAIGAADSADCSALAPPPRDQRGMPRPAGIKCDLGAYERQASDVDR